ncbi:MAG: signal peptidase I [Bradymonadia bacterium]
MARQSRGRAAIYRALRVSGLLSLLLGLLVYLESYDVSSSSMTPTVVIGDFVLVNRFAYSFGGAPARGDVVIFDDPCNAERHFVKRIMALPGDRIDVIGPETFTHAGKGFVAINGEPVRERAIDHFRAQGQYVTGEEVEASFRLGGTPHMYLATIGDETFMTLHHGESDSQAQLRGWRPEQAPHIWPVGATVNHCRAGDPLGQAEADTMPAFPWQIPEGYVMVMGDNRDFSLDSRAWGLVPEENIIGKALFIGLSVKSTSNMWEFWDSMRWSRMFRAVHGVPDIEDLAQIVDDN